MSKVLRSKKREKKSNDKKRKPLVHQRQNPLLHQVTHRQFFSFHLVIYISSNLQRKHEAFEENLMKNKWRWLWQIVARSKQERRRNGGAPLKKKLKLKLLLLAGLCLRCWSFLVYRLFFLSLFFVWESGLYLINYQFTISHNTYSQILQNVPGHCAKRFERSQGLFGVFIDQGLLFVVS